MTRKDRTEGIYNRREVLDESERRQYCLIQLKDLLSYAYRYSEDVKKRFDRAQFNVEKFKTLSDIKHIPLLKKKELIFLQSIGPRLGGLLTKEGEVPHIDRAMLADAIATTTGAICGTSTVTTFVESSAGVAEGGRTGLAAMATAALFFIAMFLSPIASLIPTAATAAALIYVGVLMINCVKDLDWMDPSVALPSFLTMAMMPFTYNISYGIAFGLISYVLIRIFTGKIREVKVGTWVITILFLLMLFLTH